MGFDNGRIRRCGGGLLDVVGGEVNHRVRGRRRGRLGRWADELDHIVGCDKAELVVEREEGVLRGEGEDKDDNRRWQQHAPDEGHAMDAE